jgi:chorismate dehydratase
VPTTAIPGWVIASTFPRTYKDKRWIVDLLQLRRVGGIIQTNDRNTSCSHASQFVMGQLHGLAGAKRLRRDGLDAGGFEFSQRRLEDVLHPAEVFDQPPCPGRAEARSEGKDQPMQGEAFTGSGTNGQGFGHFTTSTSSDSRTLTSAKNDVKVTGHIALLKSNIVRMKRLRISAISYLNTAPLMWDFEHGDAGAAFDISYTVPSQCAADLAAEAADIGIIPAAAYASIPGLAILPSVAIASRRPVRSILLVSKVPLDQIRSVALDTSSLTSVALTRVLFAKWWGPGRSFTPMAPDIKRMMAEHDAGLLIGDPALQVDRSCYLTFDLAEEWIRLTGKPFVFAFWAVRQAALRNAPPALDLAAIFQESRDHGLEPASLDRITREWAPRLGLSEAEIRAYLTENIYYDLDPACLDGLQLFYRYASECGVLPAAPELRFLDVAKIAAS